MRQGQRGVSPPRSVNVQVAVRCRPLNDRERSSGERSVLLCAEDRREVICSAPGGQRKGGASSVNPKKTYTYDQVFGQDATQADVYEGIVEPIVDEVLQGYNCTVFAYGQTGTGKTHTMEGRRDADMVDFEERRLADNAGIIPRAVKQVFDHLRSITDEHSVRVSHLELYNEQLTDLLGPEDVINDSLRMYEDPQKGTFVQGLEDVVVRSEEEIFAVLDKSAVKRKTAETLMNKYSSRSHSVFSITIHIKESTPEGADLLKVGKLNLVDLAGSENVGRSGAVKGRAREAGNINQSLLTLGRVITALVDRHPHVPYRDSKLTRLLQESLGGRNKTCVIATVTPGSSSVEETASTLDYAYRAKSIKNRPTVNQMIAKHVLLKEYTAEIQKLKKELDANRSKNGVFLPPEEYQRLQTIASQQKDAISQLETRNEDFEKKAAALKEKLDRTQEALARDQRELSNTKHELHGVKQDLESTRQTLAVVKQQKEENSHLVRNHVATESTLHQQGSELQDTVSLCISDIGALHTRVKAKRELEKENVENLSALQDTIGQNVLAFSESLQAHETANVSLLQDSEASLCMLTNNVDNGLSTIASKLKDFSESFAELEKGHAEINSALMTGFQDQSQASFEVLRQKVADRKTAVAAAEQKVLDTTAVISSTLENTQTVMSDVRSVIATHIEGEESRRKLFAEDLNEVVAQFNYAVTDRIKRQAVIFEELKLVSEKEAEEQNGLVRKTQSKLIDQVTSALQSFVQESNESRENARDATGAKIGLAMNTSTELQQSVGATSGTLGTKCQEFSANATKEGKILELTIDETNTSITKLCATANEGVEVVNSSLGELVQTTTGWHSDVTEDMNASHMSHIRFQEEAAKQRSEHAVLRGGQLAQQREFLETTKNAVQASAVAAADETRASLQLGREQVTSFVTKGKDCLNSTVGEPVKSHSIARDLGHDEAPIVRQWPIKEDLAQTRNHQELVSEMRAENSYPAVPVEDFGHVIKAGPAIDIGDLSSNESPTAEENREAEDLPFYEDKDEVESSSTEHVEEEMSEDTDTVVASIPRSRSAEPVESTAPAEIVEAPEDASAVLSDTTNRRPRVRTQRGGGESMIPKKPTCIPAPRTRAHRSRARDVN